METSLGKSRKASASTALGVLTLLVGLWAAASTLYVLVPLVAALLILTIVFAALARSDMSQETVRRGSTVWGIIPAVIGSLFGLVLLPFT